MRAADIRKNLTLIDHTTHVEGSLSYEWDGQQQTLAFIYNEGGLRFRSKLYRGWAPVFHGYDGGIYTDARGYLAPVTSGFDHGTDFAREVQTVMQRFWLRARLQPGQPVTVMVPDKDVNRGIPMPYQGYVKNVDTEDDSVLIAYEHGRQVTVKPKPFGLRDIQYQGRQGVFVILGGGLKTNEHNVVPA